MHSQTEFKPTYGSFSEREAIEIVTKISQKNIALKVPFNIGFPYIRRGGTKIKVTPPKPQDYGKEPHVLYSQAVMDQKPNSPYLVSTINRKMPQTSKIITTQTSSTVITSGNHSSTLVKPSTSITTQVSLGNEPSVARSSSQIISSVSNKSTLANVQSRPSSPDKSSTMTGSNSIENGDNANFSKSIPNYSTSKSQMNTNIYNSQQNNASNSIITTKQNTLNQQDNDLINGTIPVASINHTTDKIPVWNGINSKVVNQTGSMAIRPQNINNVANNQYQPVSRNSPGNRTFQYGPNTKINSTGVDKEPFLGSVAIKPQQNNSNIGNTLVIPNNSSIGTVGKTNTVWDGINGPLKEQNGLINVTTEQSNSMRSSTPVGFNNVISKDSASNSVKYVEQQESDNKKYVSSVTSTPSSSRRSSESNGTNTINNAIANKEQIPSLVKSNAKAKKKKGGNETSSGLNTPPQSNTPDGSRRSSTSNGSNAIVTLKEATRQVEPDNMISVSDTPNISKNSSETNSSKTAASLLLPEKNKNNGSANERPITEIVNLNSNSSVPPSKPATWAGLFSKEESQKPATENSKSNVMKPPSPPVKPQKSQKTVIPLTNGKPKVGGLAGLLKDFDPSFQNITMSPRGLINNGNMCFMNAILQSLSHCPPFCNLLTHIYKEVAHDFNSKTPLVDSLVRFIEEYKQTKRSDGSEEFGEAFSPEYVYDALRGLKRFDSMKGRQEDAEEFLGFLLDGLHEEFLAVKKDEPKNQQSDKVAKGDQKDNDWMEVGRRNRTSYTRTTDVEETPISRIFGGQFRSVLTCPGSNDSITLQPYQSLQLDIQPDDVKTIGDALKNLTVPEYVDDFYSPKNGLVRATKRLCIETLPPILTLHLKRFIYDNVGGTQKLSKHIGYSTTLSIQPDIMARRPNKAVEYRLFGVVYHHGKSATGGHYTADILCQNDWLHIDDAAISSISSEDVASVENPTQPTDRSAYILFYMKN